MIRPCILVPVFNHADGVARLVPALKELGLPTFLVNDGSDQPCTCLLRDIAAAEPWITLLERGENGGKGAAVKTGLRAAQRREYSHALQLDADGQHDLADAPRLLALAEANPEAVISGAPDYRNAPWLRFYGRYLTHVWVWINTLSLEISDSMCGYRVYPLAATARVIQSAHTGDRMDFDPEILVRLHWAGLRVIQVRTPVTYPPDGVSHFRAFRDNVLISWAHTRLFFGMLYRLPQLLRRKWNAHV